MTPKQRAEEIVRALGYSGRFVPNSNFYPGNIAGLDDLQMAIEQEIAAAVAEEREKCALLAEITGPELGGEIYAAEAVADSIARAIRSQP